MELPRDFLYMMAELLDRNALSDFEESMKEKPPVSLRQNLLKSVNLDLDISSIIPWELQGKYLHSRPIFSLDPFFHAGAYYVQEASSMLIGQAIKQHLPKEPSIRVLDLCAAPGGKSTHILDLIPEDALLVSNEIVPKRFKVLDENLIKWGRHNMIRSVASPESLSPLKGYFDLILVDAPCSGEGMMRKDEQAIKHWSDQNVTQCSIRQKDILKSALELLAPKGLLIYSTCTFNKKENEDIGDWLVVNYALEPLTVTDIESFGVCKRQGNASLVYVAYPHLVKGEGFAMQVFKRSDGFLKSSRSKDSLYNYKSGDTAILSDYFEKSENLCMLNQPDGMYFLNREHLGGAMAFLQCIKGAKIGRKAGILKGKQFIPDHELAMSHLLHKEILSLSLDKEDALRFLRGEAPELQQNLNTGWMLIMYQEIALGWVKKLENRFNNYYPNSYRLRLNLSVE